MSGERGDFFTVDARVWPVVCGLGLNPACAYLILARGTRKDMATTSWSVDAIERMTRISRANAKRAIDALVEAGLVDRLRDRPTPQTANYRLRSAYLVPGCAAYVPPALKAEAEGAPAQAPSWTWLPNALIDGAGDEDPPLELVRQSQLLPALSLLVALYEAQDLPSFGGLHWRQIRRRFTANEVGRPDGFRVLRFDASTDEAWATAPFVAPFLSSRGEAGRAADWKAFWEAWGLLKDLGLIELAPHLLDGDSSSAEIIHPFVPNGEPAEQEVATEAWRAARRLLHQHDEGHPTEWMVPVRPHQKTAALLGIYRLRYRTKAGATAAWLAQAETWERFSAIYRAIQPRPEKASVSAA